MPRGHHSAACAARRAAEQAIRAQRNSAGRCGGCVFYPLDVTTSSSCYIHTFTLLVHRTRTLDPRACRVRAASSTIVTIVKQRVTLPSKGPACSWRRRVRSGAVGVQQQQIQIRPLSAVPCTVHVAAHLVAGPDRLEHNRHAGEERHEDGRMDWQGCRPRNHDARIKK